MYGLEVRIGSARGLVTLPAYRTLLDEVRSLLVEVDQQSRRMALESARPAAEAATVTWAVRHEQDLTGGLRLRVEPFELGADEGRARLAASAVVSGVHELAMRPVIPPFFTEDAVSKLAKFAAHRGSAGIDRLNVAAVNGQVIDEAEVSDAVRENATTAVIPVTREIGSIEGVVDALVGGARASRKATVFDDRTRRAVRVTLRPEHVELFREAWGKRVAVRGLITFNRLGQAIRVAASDVIELGPLQPRERLAGLVGAASGWTSDQPLQDVMRELRRRG
jgi:hypothetical protein